MSVLQGHPVTGSSRLICADAAEGQQRRGLPTVCFPGKRSGKRRGSSGRCSAPERARGARLDLGVVNEPLSSGARYGLPEGPREPSPSAA